MKPIRTLPLLLTTLLFGVVARAAEPMPTGDLFGTVASFHGDALPGALVTVTSPETTRRSLPTTKETSASSAWHRTLTKPSPSSTASSADVLIKSGRFGNLNGLYQVAPDTSWGVNVSANLMAREGYPLPYTYSLRTDDGVRRTVLVSASESIDTTRADDLFVADVRIEKNIPFTSKLAGTLSLDAFNLFNDNAVLQRDRSLEAPTANVLTESRSPRIFRLGFRLGLR